MLPLIARLWLGFGHRERRELRMVFMFMQPRLSSDDVVGDWGYQVCTQTGFGGGGRGERERVNSYTVPGP